MRSNVTKLMVFLLIGSIITLAGCESDDDNGGSSSSSQTVAGTWLFTYTTTYDTVDPLTTKQSVITINQSGQDIWFTMPISDPPVDATFNGTVSGNSITFSMVTTTFNGTIASNWNSMSGSFNGSNSGEEWAGNWTMTRQ